MGRTGPAGLNDLTSPYQTSHLPLVMIQQQRKPHLLLAGAWGKGDSCCYVTPGTHSPPLSLESAICEESRAPCIMCVCGGGRSSLLELSRTFKDLLKGILHPDTAKRQLVTLSLAMGV